MFINSSFKNREEFLNNLVNKISLLIEIQDKNKLVFLLDDRDPLYDRDLIVQLD
jgi:hypothetical protein